MRHAYGPGFAPPPPGQEKEEPDLWQEDDIPSDNRGNAAGEEHGSEPPRDKDVERE